MSDEKIEIIIVDRIDNNIPVKIDRIAKSATSASTAITRLNQQIGKLNIGKLSQLAKVYNSVALNKKKIAVQDKALLVQAKLLEAAEWRVEKAFNAAAAAESRASIATNKAAKSSFDASLSAQKLAKEQARTNKVVTEGAIAQQKLTEANKKAAIADEKLNLAIQKRNGQAAKSSKAFLDAENAQARNIITNNKAIESEVKAKEALEKKGTAKKRNIILDNQVKTSSERLRLAEDRRTRATEKAALAQDKLAASTKKLTGSFFGLLSRFAILTGVLGTTLGLLTKFIDSYTLLGNRLRVVAENEAQVVTLTSEMASLAARTRTSVVASATAFSRFDRALEQLGASQAESIRLTETVNKSIKLSGANAGESAAGLLQLSQAFNKGKLDGDEFRTVMELLPDAADAIAKELKVTRGELLKLAPEGKITAEVMRRAFANVADEIDKKFKDSIVTIGESFTVLVDKLRIFFGEVTKRTGTSDLLAKSIISIGDAVQSLTNAFINIDDALSKTDKGFKKIISSVLLFIKNALTMNTTFAAIGGALSTLTRHALIVFKVIGSAVTSFSDFVEFSFKSMYNSFVDILIKMDTFAKKTSNKIRAVLGLDPITIESDLSKFKLEISDTAKLFGEELSKEIDRILKSDPLGDLFKDKKKKEPLRGEDPSKSGKGSSVVDVDVSLLNKVNSGVEKLIDSMKELGKLFAALNDINNQTVNNLDDIAIRTTATHIAFESGTIGLENYNSRLIAMNAELARTRDMMGDATFFDGFMVAMDTWIGRFEGAMTEAGTIFGNFAKSMSDGFAESIGRAIVFSEDLGKSLKNVAKNALAELISGLIKLGIRMILTAALGQTLAVQAAGTSTAIAAELGAAWAAPAALASLATLGTNAAPASAALVGTNALAQGLAKVPGFQSGGYTGDGGLGDVAGVVHKREFVMPADVTAENRETLEAMKARKPLPVQSGNGGSQVVENNYYISDLMTSEELAQKYVNIKEVADSRNIKPKG